MTRRAAALGLLLALFLSGCSAAGLMTGTIVDHRWGKGPASHLLRTGDGTRVTLWLKDGTKLHGRLAGFTGPADSAQRKLGNSLPPGSGVLIDSRAGQAEYPAEDIRRVSIPSWRSKIILTLLGIFTDLSLFIAYLSQFS